ncbi:MAG: Maf family protein [Candidatus Eutrophobiaceae bacterium]
MKTAILRVCLASTSPRRRALLAQINVDCDCVNPQIEEHWDSKESAINYALRLAKEKALAGLALRPALLPVLAGDTCVAIDGIVMGKPENTQQAAEILRRLSGRTHNVVSAIALLLDRGNLHTAVSVSQVSFAKISEQRIQAYCQSSEPIGKAGAYAIQGTAATWINRIEGSYSGVMGLPLHETACLLGLADG